MNDQPEAESIDASVIANFFQARAITPRCNFCHSEKLSVSEVTFAVGFRVGSRLGTYANIYDLNSRYSPEASAQLYTLTCNNCGHTMAFDLSVILDWLKSIRTNTIKEENDE